MSFRILVSEVVTDNGLDALRSHGCEIKRGQGLSKEQLIADLQDCDAMIMRVARLDAEVLSACPRLKVIGKHGVGVDSIDLDYCKAHGITVVFTPQANSMSVAEHAIALMMACAKQIPLKCAEYRKGNYGIKDTFLGSEVNGKTIGLVGMGRIGTMVGRIAADGFGMRVLAYDPFLPESATPAGFERAATREELYEQADFVSLHLPSTKETVHSVGAEAFRRMKKTAYLINTARGNVVDEKALFEALVRGEIGGAGLDVSDPEPSSPDNPLMQLPNVIMTPHCAAATVDSMLHMSADVAKGVWEALSGQTPTWKVC